MSSEHLEKLKEMELIDVDGEIATLRTILGRVPIAIVGANQDGHITYFNLAAQTMFGISLSEALGSSLTLLMPERYRAAHLAALNQYHARIPSNPEVRKLEGHGLRANGAEFAVEITLAAYPENEKVSFTATIREVGNGR